MEVFPTDIQKIILSFTSHTNVPYNVYAELVKAEMHLRWFSDSYVYLGPFVDTGYQPRQTRLKKLPKFIVKLFPYGMDWRQIICRRILCWELVGEAEKKIRLQMLGKKYDFGCMFFGFWIEWLTKLGYYPCDRNGTPVPYDDPVAPIIRHTSRVSYAPDPIWPPRHTTRPGDPLADPGDP